MIDKPDPDRNAKDEGRQARLRAALRENLKRRKSQSRGRADQTADAEVTDQQRRADDAIHKE
ncbi:MAG: hypothetical protein J0H40_16190 [Rhizobiales bacterium]|nr:hypothetical protein [Hyphomicrobiales bacterium]